ncbi:MAG: transcription termination factor NusA [Anaerolineae bacterium]
MKSEFEIAITQLSADRNLEPEVILGAIEEALVSAYKRNYGSSQNVNVTIHPRTGRAQVFIKKAVVKEVEDESNEISLAEAKTHDPEAEIGDFIDIEVRPRNFGRIAAQTAKQVITQRIRDAERDSVYLEYADRVGDVVNAVVRNVDSRSRNVVLGLGKAEALLPRSEQISREQYRLNQRLRVYILDVERGGSGPQIIVSRAHPQLLRRLFELEVPEVFSGAVEIKAIAREPGNRSKVAVTATQEGVDPVGSCVGMRGVRIRNIVNELSGEKIDVVAWDADTKTFIANALSPASVTDVYLDEEERTAQVVVPDRALSLAIGKEGQNARLAAKLTGWRIDIKSETEAAEKAERLAAEREKAKQREKELEEARKAANQLLARAEASLDEEGEAPEEAQEESAEPTEVKEDEEEKALEEADSTVEQTPSEETSSEASEEVTEKIEEAASEGEKEVKESVPEKTASTAETEEVQEAISEAAPKERDAEVEATPSTAKSVEPQEDEQGETETDAEEETTETSNFKRTRIKDQETEFTEQELEEGDSKRTGRRLEYDEDLGRVVSRKRRKSNRRNWEEEWEKDLP